MTMTMITIITTVMLAAEISAWPTRMARTIVSEMRMADLASSASGYAYSQRGGLPVSYVRYTNHGSGRYYGAPAPVYYTVADGGSGGSGGDPAPVAPVGLSETASPHETGATARHQVTRPYQPDGFINYDWDQLARYARPFARTVARAPYYAANMFKPSETTRKADKRNTDRLDEDDEEDAPASDNYDEDDSGEKGTDKDRATESRENASVDSAEDSVPVHGLDDPRPDIDVSLEHGEEHSLARDSAHGENSHEGYNKRLEFDVGERGLHDKNGRRGRLLFTSPVDFY